MEPQQVVWPVLPAPLLPSSLFWTLCCSIIPGCFSTLVGCCKQITIKWRAPVQVQSHRISSGPTMFNNFIFAQILPIHLASVRAVVPSAHTDHFSLGPNVHIPSNWRNDHLTASCETNLNILNTNLYQYQILIMWYATYMKTCYLNMQIHNYFEL